MHSHIDRLAALPLVALLAVAATGCAVAPASEADGKTSSAITVVMPPPGVLTLGPVQDCSLTAANESSGYPASPGKLYWGTSAASSSTCDYYVTEVTGVQAKSVLLAVVATPDLITDATSCTESYETFLTYGYVPMHFVFNGINVTEVPGAWEYIESKTIYGVWLGAMLPGNANCAFNTFVEPYPATTASTGIITDSPYSTLRVATKAIYYTNGVASRAPMGVYAVPEN